MRYIEQNPLGAGIVDQPEKYPFSSYNVNIKIEKDSLVDKDDNPAYLSFGNTTEARIKRYKGFVSEPLENSKLELVRKSLGGQSHFASEKFQAQINELLALKQKKQRGAAKKAIIYP
ncbi:MAG: hypothetical protein COV72_08100 [Candidatus Omnitrophica bacterium CG11_big_fil_rev_8_21_14_0_20_42_13]|uniref:Transposase n=1 Tax=Candidatus Ghiorseimicrobium undicola TaxID=1974746 RepID=A0A2H0LVR9_9BACT|nr:MAG: hypothetical protein COV72_08100 [Candidatus Omnitrophica bacterium CG11_big_fil_rev_8_21_14_0_20_42_13]